VDERVNDNYPEYLMISCGYEVARNTGYRLPRSSSIDTTGLHSGEYFREQAERDLARLNRQLYRASVAACVVVAVIYCAVKFL
jgi:hypothetical protein